MGLCRRCSRPAALGGKLTSIHFRAERVAFAYKRCWRHCSQAHKQSAHQVKSSTIEHGVHALRKTRYMPSASDTYCTMRSEAAGGKRRGLHEGNERKEQPHVLHVSHVSHGGPMLSRVQRERESCSLSLVSSIVPLKLPHCLEERSRRAVNGTVFLLRCKTCFVPLFFQEAGVVIGCRSTFWTGI